IAQEEEVRRDARVHAGSARVIGLGENVGEREERGEPEGAPHPRRTDVLAQPVALETEIADAHRHQREGRIEDRHRVRDGEPTRHLARSEAHGDLVDHPDGDSEENRQREGGARALCPVCERRDPHAACFTRFKISSLFIASQYPALVGVSQSRKMCCKYLKFRNFFRNGDARNRRLPPQEPRGVEGARTAPGRAEWPYSITSLTASRRVSTNGAP